MGSTQLSPIWLRVVGGGAAQTSQRNVALGYPELSSCPLAERTMTRSHWVERLPNHWTILRRQLIPPESSSAFSQLLWSVAVTWKWPK